MNLPTIAFVALMPIATYTFACFVSPTPVPVTLVLDGRFLFDRNHLSDTFGFTLGTSGTIVIWIEWGSCGHPAPGPCPTGSADYNDRLMVDVRQGGNTIASASAGSGPPLSVRVQANAGDCQVIVRTDRWDRGYSYTGHAEYPR